MSTRNETLAWALAPEFLHDRMAFIAGPRQVGKTTAVNDFLAREGQPALYYNWDTPSVKKRFAADPAFFASDLPPHLTNPWVAIDEIHKYPKWKNILKGYYDEYKKRTRFIVTGSARLDLFRRSGDSLVGRYFLFHMLPLGWREVVGRMPDPWNDWHPKQNLPMIPAGDPGVVDAVTGLLHLTGFPQPFFAGTEGFCTRWRENYVSLVLQDDMRELTRIVELRKLDTLVYLLPERVGSPLSLNNLRQTLECAHGTVKTWMKALELVYLVFGLKPWTTRLARSVLKEEKWYFWDWGMVEDPGARFENFIAVQLMRAVAAWNEWGKGPYMLHYLRTKDGAEADFAITDRKQVHCVIEVKQGDSSVSKSLTDFKLKTGAQLAFQIVNVMGMCTQKGPGIYLIGADRFLNLLP